MKMILSYRLTELKLYNELLNKDINLNDFQNESEKLFIQKMLHDYKYNVSHTAEALQFKEAICIN